MKHGKCFWCDKVAPLTRDHVVPQVRGGEDYNNIVMACSVCQDSRAQITHEYGLKKKLVMEFSVRYADVGHRRKKHLRNLHRKALARRPKIIELVTKWQAIEIERWGSSPSAEMDLTLPDIPTLKKETTDT